MTKGFKQPKAPTPLMANAAPKNPAMEQQILSMMGQLVKRVQGLENNVQNVFGFLECKTNSIHSLLLDAKIYPEETYKARFEEENKKLVDMMESVQDAVAKRKVSEDPAENGDWVTIDFYGTVNGEGFKGNEGKGWEFKIGEGTTLPDLDRSILGKKSGDEYDALVKFPKDYFIKEIADKEAVFKVKVLKVKKPVKEETPPTE